MRHILRITLIIGLVIPLIIGCNGSQQKSDKIEVEFWHALGGPLEDALKTLVDEFNKTHPQIQVNAISMGNYQALSQKLMAAILANTQPDMGQAYESWTANFIEGDAIVPIEKFIKGENGLTEEELADFYPVFLKSVTINDTIWAFPFNKSIRVLYYNKDVFYRNGLDMDSPPRTWDEFVEVCKKLTQDPDGDGIIDLWGTTFSGGAWQFENLLLQAGGKIMDEDNTEPLFNSEAGVEALNYLYDLLHTHKVAYLSTGYDGQNDFLASKVAMIEGSSVSTVFLQKGHIPFNLGLAPIPTHRTKQCLISGTNVVIFKDAEDPENEKKQAACWEFIKWFTSPEQTARWSAMTFYMPLRKSALEYEVLQKQFEKFPGLKDVYAQLDYASVEPQIPEWFEIRKYLEERVIERVLRGQINPQDALDELANTMKKMLTEGE